MRGFVFFLFVMLFSALMAQSRGTKVALNNDTDGFKLIVDGEPFMVKGMNWDYYPVGTNYTYNLWDESESTIKSILDSEMPLLQKMGVNTLRIYSGIPKQWITYIYKNFGLYTVLNHTFGRYGLEVNNDWKQFTDYGNENVKEILLRESIEMVNQYKDTPGLLLYLLGNENNYGLYWEQPPIAP